MDIQKRRDQLLQALAEARDQQRQADLMLNNARAAEHQLLGGIAILDELLAGQKKEANNNPAEAEPEVAEPALAEAQA